MNVVQKVSSLANCTKRRRAWHIVHGLFCVCVCVCVCEREREREMERCLSDHDLLSLCLTSWPARRCSGIRTSLNFVASLLLLRSVISRFAITQLTDQQSPRPVEKLCFSLKLYWLREKKKGITKPLANDKRKVQVEHHCLHI